MISLKRILLIRHGETDWNSLGKFQGKTDTPLSENGIKQAEALAERLKGVEIDYICSSPLERAVNTAKPIARLKGLEVVTYEELREVDFGHWEGLTLGQIMERFPEEFEKCRKDPYKYGFRFGLSFDDVMETVRSFADKLEGIDGNIAVVSHSVPLKMLMLYYTGWSHEFLHSFRLDNCSVSVIGTDKTENDDKNILIKLNDTGYINQ